MTTSIRILENMEHGITVKAVHTEYFGLQLTVMRNGITAFQGQAKFEFLDRMIEELELTQVSLEVV